MRSMVTSNECAGPRQQTVLKIGQQVRGKWQAFFANAGGGEKLRAGFATIPARR